MQSSHPRNFHNLIFGDLESQSEGFQFFPQNFWSWWGLLNGTLSFYVCKNTPRICISFCFCFCFPMVAEGFP